MAAEVITLRGKILDAVLLNGCQAAFQTFTFVYIDLCCLGQRGFLLQWVMDNAETQNWSKY